MNHCTSVLVSPRSITTVFRPQAFYEALLYLIRHARRRLIISTLYLGIARKEEEIVRAINSRVNASEARGNTCTSTLTDHFSEEWLDLHDGKEFLIKPAAVKCRGPLPKVRLLLDYLRGSRKDRYGHSSATKLSQLLHQQQPADITISFFRNPQTCGRLAQWYPPRIPEAMGVQHMKAAVADDVVLLTGANLNNDYFTNRADRSILIRDQQTADIVTRVICATQRNSYTLRKVWDGRGNLSPSSIRKDLGGDKSASSPTCTTRESLFLWDSNVSGIPDPLNDSAQLRRQLSTDLLHALTPYNSTSTNGESHHTILNEHAHQQCTFTDGRRHSLPNGVPNADRSRSCLLTLGLQAGFCDPPLNGQQQLLDASFGGSRYSSRTAQLIVVASPYLNFSSSTLQKLRDLLRRNTELILLTAAPEANSFFNSRGISSWIPEAYASIACSTWDELVVPLSQTEQLTKGSALESPKDKLGLRTPATTTSSFNPEILEFKRPGWTFHTKGIWRFGVGNFGHPSTRKTRVTGVSVIEPLTTNVLLNRSLARRVPFHRNSRERLVDNIAEQVESPSVTVFGSSNFSRRSEGRDLELLASITTNDMYLTHQMKKEVAAIVAHSRAMDKNKLRQRCPKWLNFIVRKCGLGSFL